MAVHENYPEVVKVLLERGVDLKAENDKGETALEMAKSRHDTEMVKLLTAAEAGK
jgi:ankyrin repeat protein